MKKILICLIISLILSSITVFAVSEPICADINLENYEITVSGNLGLQAAYRMVTLAVVKSGEALPEASDEISGFTHILSDFYLTYADENGEYEFSAFQLFQNSGEYEIRITADNGSTYSITKYLPSKTQFDRIVGSISDGDKDTIYQTLEDSKEELLKISDLTLYYGFNKNKKLDICETLADSEYTTLEEIIDRLHVISITYDILTNESGNRLYEYLYPEEGGFDPAFTAVLTEITGYEDKKSISVIADFDKCEKEEKLTILETLAKKNKDDIDEFFSKLKISTINYLFDTVDNWTDISDYIKKYSEDVLEGLDYAKYKKSSDKSKIDKSLIGKSFDTVDELCEYINTFDSSDSESSGGGFGSQSGGGGGGGSRKPSGGISSAPVAPIIPEIPADNIAGTASTFTYMKGYEWADKEIGYLYAKNIVNGSGNGRFSPERNVTREEFVKMLVSASGIEKYDHYSFSDIAEDNWAYPYIMKAVSAGIVKGISETEFGMGSCITRQDMAVLAFRMLGADKKDVSGAEFSDTDTISAYAKEAVNAMSSLGIIKGYSDGSFRPLALCNRAEAAVVIYRVINALGAN